MRMCWVGRKAIRCVKLQQLPEFHGRAGVTHRGDSNVRSHRGIVQGKALLMGAVKMPPASAGGDMLLHDKAWELSLPLCYGFMQCRTLHQGFYFFSSRTRLAAERKDEFIPYQQSLLGAAVRRNTHHYTNIRRMKINGYKQAICWCCDGERNKENCNSRRSEGLPKQTLLQKSGAVLWIWKGIPV